MSLELRWVGEDDLDRVAETRLYCFASGRNELQRFKDILRADRKGKAGDYLLAERQGRAIGTATSLSQKIWIRGQLFDCQGVAWVGAIRSERRGGVASSVMREVVRKGRERGQVVSALMPFRVSFYEKFGYGSVERRCEWTLPLSILPTGDAAGVRFMQADDRPALIECQHRMASRGQCDMQRPAEEWDYYLSEAEVGYVFVDRPVEGGPIHGWMCVRNVNLNGRSLAGVAEMAYDDWTAFRRLLYVLAGLKDQYWGAIMTMPVDVPLNWLLREVQVPHRPVRHAVADMKVHNRMQLRVLDHSKLIGGMRLPQGYRGEAVVAVQEVEGGISKFNLEIAEGRAEAKTTEASADVVCADRVWAAIVCGDLPIEMAIKLGLAEACGDGGWEVLEAFAMGPVPFCRDYF